MAFSTNRAGKKILWEQSKRLLPGSIVVMSRATDAFRKDCKVAVIAARPLYGVQKSPSEVDLFFASHEDLEVDPQEEWLMLEARAGYYEAYRHTLKALQKMMSEKYVFDFTSCRGDRVH